MKIAVNKASIYLENLANKITNNIYVYTTKSEQLY